jgi:hypothetical protein
VHEPQHDGPQQDQSSQDGQHMQGKTVKPAQKRLTTPPGSLP